MSDFSVMRDYQIGHINALLKNNSVLYETGVDKDYMYDLYQSSFPVGTNEIFRKFREHECSCCKQFIRNFGHIVVLQDNIPVTIWDFDTHSTTYQPVVDALAAYVKSCSIVNVHIPEFDHYGTYSNKETIELLDKAGVVYDKKLVEWGHFYYQLQPTFLKFYRSKFPIKSTIPTIQGELRSTKEIFQRALDELTAESVEIFLDLVARKLIYRGEEYKTVLEIFQLLQKQYYELPEEQKVGFLWEQSIEYGRGIAGIRNNAPGVLLIDISKGELELEAAIKKFEKAVMCPSTFKRPKAEYSLRDSEKGIEWIRAEGLEDSLLRRFATVYDIPSDQILFSDRSQSTAQDVGLLADMMAGAKVTPKKVNLDRITQMSIEDFIKNVLPRVSKIEVLFEPRHVTNLVSLTTAKIANTPGLFQWNNPFGWVYNLNLADSMIRENVQKAGGNLEGIMRQSIMWNDDPSNVNLNDYDLHCVEPDGFRIYYGNNIRRNYSENYSSRRTLGYLDVDARNFQRDFIATENIVYPQKSKLYTGLYKYAVHCFAHLGGTSGFKGELVVDGTTYQYNYPYNIRSKEWVQIADVHYDQKTGVFTVQHHLEPTIHEEQAWGLKSQQFYPVSVMMVSPNYWGEHGIGNKHYFFMIQNCKNPDTPRGFFNEFLRSDYQPYRRFFEALGGRAKVEASENQLSGVGFSSTMKNSCTVKVSGSFSQMIQINF